MGELAWQVGGSHPAGQLAVIGPRVGGLCPRCHLGGGRGWAPHCPSPSTTLPHPAPPVAPKTLSLNRPFSDGNTIQAQSLGKPCPVSVVTDNSLCVNLIKSNWGLPVFLRQILGRESDVDFRNNVANLRCETSSDWKVILFISLKPIINPP